MNRTLLRAVVSSLVLGACTVPASAQDRQRVVVFAVQDLSGPSAGRDFEQPITEAIAAELDSSGQFDLVGQAEWEAAAQARSVAPRDLLGGTAAAGLARALNAAIAVSGAYAVEGAVGSQQIALSLQCWDTASGRLLAGLQRTARFDLAFYLSLHDWIAQLVQSLQSGSSVPTQAAEAAMTPPPAGEMTFRSPDDGMRVLIAGDTTVGVVANGKVTFPVGAMPVGTPLTVTKEKAGYHESVQAVKSAPLVSLTPLAKAHTSAAEVMWTSGQFLGLGGALRGYWVPDSFYVYTGNYLYVQTLAVPALRAVVHDDFSWGLGHYLFLPAEAPVRFSISAGVGVVFSAFSQPGLPLYTDFYLDVASWTLETRILGPTLFIRQDFKYTLGIASNLEGRGWPVKGLPLTTIGVLFQ